MPEGRGYHGRGGAEEAVRRTATTVVERMSDRRTGASLAPPHG